MDQHLTSQSSTIFRNAHSLIYIFDAESPDLLSSDTHYFLKCLAALQHQNPPSTPRTNGGGAGGAVAATSDAPSGPTVFVLLHKMDLVPEALQASKLAEFVAEVKRRAADAGWKGDLRFYGTSIWNETLYRVSSFLHVLRGSEECGDRLVAYWVLFALPLLETPMHVTRLGRPLSRT